MKPYIPALAAIVLSLTEVAAQTIPNTKDKETLRVYLEAMIADSFCPNVRVNLPQLRAYLESQGTTSETITGKYPEFYNESESIMVRGINEDRNWRCQFYLDELGDAGVHPHILLRR